MLEPEIREQSRLIDVHGDLLSATLGGHVLSARERCAPAAAGEVNEIVGDERHRPPRAFLPRCVSRRVDDDLAHDPPARVVRVAASDEKSGQRLGHSSGLGLGPMTIEMPQCRAHLTAVLNRLGELTRRLAGVRWLLVDTSSVVLS